MTPEEDAKQARLYGFKIADILRLKKSGKQSKVANRLQIEKVLHELLQRPNEDPTPVLWELYNGLPYYHRDKDLILNALKILWLVPMHSQLKQGLFRLMPRWLLQIQNTHHKRLVQEYIRRSLESSFETERGIAIELKKFSPVSEIEIETLNAKTLSYPDVQYSIALRIIEHGQLEYLDHLLDYFISLADDIYDEESNQRLGNLFRHMEKLPNDEVFLRKMFDFYIDNFHRSKFRGWIMQLLTHYGALLHSALVEVYKQKPEQREAIVLLLSHMTGFGQSAALEGLFEIYKAAPETQITLLTQNIEKSLIKLSSRPHVEKTKVFGILQEKRTHISEDSAPRWTLLAGTIDRFQKSNQLTPTDVPYLLLSASQSHIVWQVRYARAEIFDALLHEANNNAQYALQSRALRLAATMSLISSEIKFRSFWRLFLDTSSEKLKIEALELMAKNAYSGNNIQAELYQQYQRSSAQVQQAILSNWNTFFQTPMPDVVKQHDK